MRCRVKQVQAVSVGNDGLPNGKAEAVRAAASAQMSAGRMQCACVPGTIRVRVIGSGFVLPVRQRVLLVVTVCITICSFVLSVRQRMLPVVTVCIPICSFVLPVRQRMLSVVTVCIPICSFVLSVRQRMLPAGKPMRYSCL